MTESNRTAIGLMSSPTVVWNERLFRRIWSLLKEGGLPPEDERGAVQAGYLLLCAHFEEFVVGMFRTRLRLVNMHATYGGKLGRPGQDALAEMADHVLLKLVESSMSGVEGETFGSLASRYEDLFGSSLKSVIGSDEWAALQGLAAVRNHIAHGRPIFIEMELAGGAPSRVKVTESRVGPALQFLIAKKVYKVTAQAADAYTALFSQEALALFFDMVGSAERKLLLVAKPPDEVVLNVWVGEAIAPL
jgi:hypothetical protein